RADDTDSQMAGEHGMTCYRHEEREIAGATVVSEIRSRIRRRMLQIELRPVSASRLERVVCLVEREGQCKWGEALPPFQRDERGGITDAVVDAEIHVARLYRRLLESVIEAERPARRERARERRTQAITLVDVYAGRAPAVCEYAECSLVVRRAEPRISDVGAGGVRGREIL